MIRRGAVLGISLRSSGTRDALAPQDWLYCRAERDGTGEQLAVMAALTGVVVGAGAALEHLVDPAVRIVTLTVTEKGYCRDAATGALDEDDAAIRRDLAMPDAPGSVPGLLAIALRRRRDAGVAPFTVLSCDNLPANGATTRRVVTRFAALVDPSLGHFVADRVAFPDCMVDRIVPATSADDRIRIDAALGVHDAWPVVCEPFSQWVIEDRFPQGRPAWELTGAELVSDVRPYEDMKLRLLNGSHSSIAYLGQLAGWQTVADAIAVPELREHIGALMSEVATTLVLPGSVDLDGYRDALLTRFANPALRHRTAQIAMDGSQKLPQRLFAPALVRLAAGQRVAAHRAWVSLPGCGSCKGAPMMERRCTLDDPQAERLRAVASAAQDPAALCDAMFAMADIVPPALAPFRDDVLAALNSLSTHGARQTVVALE